MAGTFLTFTTREWENSRLLLVREENIWKHHSDTAKFPRKWVAALWLFVFSFFIKQKLCFIFKSCLCTFSKWEMQTISCYWRPGCLYCLVRQQQQQQQCPSLHIRGAWWRGSMFSHTLGWRTFKCYLMLAGVHVDTVGFFGRASESMHNNFAIYCGLVMVHCRCYIGLECTILFLREPTRWVVGHYGHCPTRDLYNKSRWLGPKRPMKLPFWRRTFLRRLCQHYNTATSFIKKYDWQSRRWILPQCFPTNCPVGISKVSSSVLKFANEWCKFDD